MGLIVMDMINTVHNNIYIYVYSVIYILYIHKIKNFMVTLGVSRDCQRRKVLENGDIQFDDF